MSAVHLPDPFDDQVAKWATRCATPAIIATLPDVEDAYVFANGTFTLVRLADRFLGLTCAHVIREYEKHAPDGACLQAGDLILDVDNALLSLSEELDLAVLDLTTYVDGAQQLKQERFVVPGQWPPNPVPEEVFVSVAGYPGQWRKTIGPGEVFFFELAAGLNAVPGPYDCLAASFNFDQSTVVANAECVFKYPGGMSGGPLFAWRDGPLAIADLVGVIQQYYGPLEALLIRKLDSVAEDGTISGG